MFATYTERIQKKNTHADRHTEAYVRKGKREKNTNKCHKISKSWWRAFINSFHYPWNFEITSKCVTK